MLSCMMKVLKVKLALYRTFSIEVGFKKYLYGTCDVGSRLLFKFMYINIGQGHMG